MAIIKTDDGCGFGVARGCPVEDARGYPVEDNNVTADRRHTTEKYKCPRATVPRNDHSYGKSAGTMDGE